MNKFTLLCRKGDMDTIKAYEGETDLEEALLYACEADNLSLVKFLIEKGVNYRYDGDLPFMSACFHNSINVIIYFIDVLDIPVNAKNNIAINYAFRNRNSHLVFELMKRGADLFSITERSFLVGTRDTSCEI